jgi:type IV pilus assembly protein PilB
MAQPRPGAPASRRLGDLLVTEGLLDSAALERALVEQRATTERLGSVLLRLGLLREEQLTGFLSRQYGVPAIALSQLDIDPAVLQLVPEALARKHEVLPVRRARSTLTLAMADPTNVFAVDDISFLTTLTVVPVVAPETAIRRAIERSYGSRAAALGHVLTALAEESGAGALEVVGDEAPAPLDAVELKESADGAPVVRLVNMLLVEAIDKGASDVHWEPYETVLRVRCRIDGALHELLSSPRRLEPAVLSRLKVMACLDIAERRVPQDGRMKLRFRGRPIDVRVSVLPTVFGEKAVLRVLDPTALELDLARLGFDPRPLERVQHAIRQPHGMVLITGPTGSGKTTTLYSAIHAINTPDINIVTAEDPVEYNLRGVNQVQINEGVGRTFAGVLRAFLRQDPDVILVGETRDLETAQIAIRAALTGHLVLSTLHTNDCPSTVARLVDMGVPPFLVASALTLVVAQRLARRVCGDCREPHEVDGAALVPAGAAATAGDRVTLARGRGCASCNFTGYRGRVALYEVMPITPDLRDMILKGVSSAEIRALAQAQGMDTLRQAGLQKVLAGVTTLDELLRVTTAT